MAAFYLRFLAQRRSSAVLFAIAVIVLTIGSVSAQSIDPNAPSPVRSNDVSGRIAARDLGDARLTDHYYALTGTPGDLLITVNSTNLNGDIDVFTATTLRPLLKLTMYAESTAPVTKGIYLRKREALILRVEARSPNDDEGTYRLSFGGTFEPIVGGPEMAEAETPTVTETTPSGPRKTKRVSSVGARIEEPEPPVTELAKTTHTPEPTPEPTPEAKPVETPAATEKSPEVEKPKPTTARNTRGRRPARPHPAPKVRETPAPVEEPKPKPAPAEPEPEVGPRLVIETNDGTLINRSMSTVRRVTVENGQVVVTGKDGKIDRILLSNIVRMSIAP